jgi:hypothetical protein
MIRGASRQEILEQMGEWEKRLQVAGAGAHKGETGSSGFDSLSTYVDGAMRYWRKHLGLPTSDS